MKQPISSDVHSRLRTLAETGTIREIEQAVIELRVSRLGTIPRAAESLGVSEPMLYKKVRHYRLAAGRRDAGRSP